MREHDQPHGTITSAKKTNIQGCWISLWWITRPKTKEISGICFVIVACCCGLRVPNMIITKAYATENLGEFRLPFYYENEKKTFSNFSVVIVSMLMALNEKSAQRGSFGLDIFVGCGHLVRTSARLPSFKEGHWGRSTRGHRNRCNSCATVRLRSTIAR